MSRRNVFFVACSSIVGCLLATGTARSAEETPTEEHPGIEVSYGTLKLRDGVKLRTIVTKPAGTEHEKLPAILFVQWLSCNTVAISSHPRDGWSAMLRRVVRESGALVWRTEKRGVGSSEGDCSTMDYDTELADHREALKALMARPDVDRERIVLFGGSIGGTYVPLLAAETPTAGVMVWGAGATTWAERMLKFERNALELRMSDPQQLSDAMRLRFTFFERYLVAQQSPSRIAKENPAVGAVWTQLVGTSPDAHYGRPFAFHQQAQRADWAGAWSRVTSPVLVTYGEYDWFESADAASLITRIVNSRTKGQGTFHLVPRMNHHFEVYADPSDAFREENGRVDPDPAVGPMLKWLEAILKTDRSNADATTRAQAQ